MSARRQTNTFSGGMNILNKNNNYECITTS